jgi:hypothetical protein
MLGLGARRQRTRQRFSVLVRLISPLCILLPSVAVSRQLETHHRISTRLTTDSGFAGNRKRQVNLNQRTRCGTGARCGSRAAPLEYRLGEFLQSATGPYEVALDRPFAGACFRGGLQETLFPAARKAHDFVFRRDLHRMFQRAAWEQEQLVCTRFALYLERGERVRQALRPQF